MEKVSDKLWNKVFDKLWNKVSDKLWKKFLINYGSVDHLLLDFMSCRFGVWEVFVYAARLQHKVFN